MQVPDYDHESGVYLGPARTFDDEVLEYLSKEDEQKILEQQEELPASPLIVDSKSGIYLGFEENQTAEDSDDNDSTEDDSTEGCDTKKQSNSRPSWNLFKIKQSSKYEVNTETDPNTTNTSCFKFVKKVWRKAEECQ